MTHTPGPWFVADWQNDFGTDLVTIEARSVDPSGKSSIWPHGIQKHKIASTEGGENPIADARLISAAPDLLAALEPLLMRWADPLSITEQHWNAARDAIKKSRGKS